MFKIEVEDGHGSRSAVCGADGALLTFSYENGARAKLVALNPVIVQMEQFGGHKRARMVLVFRADQEWKDGTPPH